MMFRDCYLVNEQDYSIRYDSCRRKYNFVVCEMEDLKITEDQMCSTIPTEDYVWTTLATICGIILCIVYLIIILFFSISVWKRYEEKNENEDLEINLQSPQ